MKKMSCMLTLFVLGTAPFAASASDPHGGVHIILPGGGCEDLEEDCVIEDEPGREQEVWYRNPIFEDPEEDRDIPGWLENETQWPGQREEFSDYLFR
jgi:hypothetical protein